MAEMVERDISFVQQRSGAARDARMELRRFSEKERKLRAAKGLLALWCAAAVSILIPVAHFVLVPGFLIAGAVVGRRLWNTEEEGVAARGACPACGGEVRLDLEKRAELPQWRACPECGESIELRGRE